jgi:hypothetical protein
MSFVVTALFRRSSAMSFAALSRGLSPESVDFPAPPPPCTARRKSRPVNAVATLPRAGQQRIGHALVDDLNVGFQPANLRRCPGCGGMVYLWPCLGCGQRRAAVARPAA